MTPPLSHGIVTESEDESESEGESERLVDHVG
jgi:hypothetical protein